VAHAWLPGARRIRAGTDGGRLKGGAPRAVWLTLGTAPRQVCVQSAASRLLLDERPCHLIWDPVTGEMAQLISVLRAGLALGAPERLGWRDGGGPARDVNTEGRICVQIGVLAHPGEPFTDGPMTGAEAIIAWLDSWGIPRRWPAGPPAHYHEPRHVRSRALWARGGYFGASQVPGCGNAGPGDIDIERLTGARLHQVRPVTAASALPIPA
jgi:hypothetical protein